MNENQIESQDDTSNPGHFVVGLLLGSFVGSLIGAVTMLFLAPQSGKKARRQLRARARKAGKQTARAVDDGVSQVRVKARQVGSDLQEQAGELQQRGLDAVDQQRDRLASAVESSNGR